MNVLVLCTGNSARSILLEAMLNTFGKGRVAAYSAGSNPSGRVHPQSLVMLTENGHDTSCARSKSWDEFGTQAAPTMDLVITVCGSAAQEECPMWPGVPLRTHWGVEDPAAVSPQDWDQAFRTAYAILEKRAQAFLALEFEHMPKDMLTTELSRIGEVS